MAGKVTQIHGRRCSDADDAIDRTHALILQLDAATSMINADGFDHFHNLNKDLQRNYVWMLADMAGRLRFAQHEVDEEETRRGARGGGA